MKKYYNLIVKVEISISIILIVLKKLTFELFESLSIKFRVVKIDFSKSINSNSF